MRLTSALESVEHRLPRSRLLTYALAVGVTLVAVLLTLVLQPAVHRAVFIFFFVAVVVSAFFGGAGPGLAATVLAMIASLVPPLRSLPVQRTIDLLPIAIFFVSGSFISAICGSFREARARAEAQASELETQASELAAQTHEAQLAALELEAANERLGRIMAEERNARLTESRLAAIVSSSDDAIVSLSLDGVILSWNEGATRLFGFPADEVLGQPASVLHPPGHDAMEEPRLLAKLQQGEHVSHVETVRRRKDGVLIDVSVSLSPVRDADGRITSVAKIVRDVTERNAAERMTRFLGDAGQALASSLDLERTVQTLANLAVPALADCCVVDLLESVTEARRGAAVCARPEKQLLLDELSMRYPPDPNRASFSKKVLATAKPELITEVTSELLRRVAPESGRRALIEAMDVRSFMVIPLTERGVMLGVMILAAHERTYTTSDLTLAVELGRRGALALENARLYRAAHEASRAKSEFLATMSHELRTPLTAIIGYEELLADGITGPVSESQRQQLRRIKSSATHLLGLIDEVLTFSRVEAGREMVRVELIDARRVVKDASEIMQPLATEKQLGFHLTLPDDRLEMCSDPAKLRQILLNLLSNAIKFTETGSVSVDACVAANGDDVLFIVRDTGIGIAPENTSRVFDPFWQVEQNATRKVGGTGLGLSVTRQLAHLLGGDVSVDSVVGRGSAFTVRLPAEL